MSDDWKQNEMLASAITVITNRNIYYQRTVERILKAPSVQGDMNRLNYLLKSYIHMLVNRLFVSNQRKTELVIYEYLLKYYDSKIAREKLNIAPIPHY